MEQGGRRSLSLYHEFRPTILVDSNVFLSGIGAFLEPKYPKAFQENLSELIHYQKKLHGLLFEGTTEQPLLLDPICEHELTADANDHEQQKFVEPFSGGGGFLVFTDRDDSAVDEEKRSALTELINGWLWGCKRRFASGPRQGSICSTGTEELDKLVRKIVRRIRLLLGGLGYLQVDGAVLRHWIVSPIAPRIVLPRSFSDILL